MVLVDTNVILDVVTGDPRWSDWSRRQLVQWLDAVLPAHLYDYRAIPRQAASLAARAHAA